MNVVTRLAVTLAVMLLAGFATRAHTQVVSISDRQDFSSEAWTRNNINNAQFSQIGWLIREWPGENPGLKVPWVPHRAGYITGLSASTEDVVSGSGQSWVVRIYLNGQNTNRYVVLTGAASSNYVNLAEEDWVEFAAGDHIMLGDVKTGTLNNVGGMAQWFGCWKE